MKKNIMYLDIKGVLFPDNHLELQPTSLTDNPNGAVDFKDSPLKIELLSKEKILLRWHANLIEKNYPSEFRNIHERKNIRKSNIFVVETKIPFPIKTNQISFYYEDILIHQVIVPKEKPKFTQNVKINKKADGSYTLKWTATIQGNRQLYYDVKVSSDSGQTWRYFKRRITKNNLQMRNDQLIGGDDCIVEVIAYHNVHTVRSRIRVSDSQPRKLKTVITSPTSQKDTIKPPVLLRAIAYPTGIGGFSSDEVKYIWTANGKKIADKQYGFWRDIKPGQYLIKVNTKWKGLEAVDEVEIQVGN